MKKIIKEFIGSFLKWFDKNYIYFYLTLFLILSINSLYILNKTFAILSLIVFYIFVFVFFKIKQISKRIKAEEIRNQKRFTNKNEKGDIWIKPERLNQAIIYLSILEDSQEGL